MALSSSNAVKQLSDANSQGTVLGQSSTDLIGFYGVTTPVKQAVVGGSITTGSLASSLAFVLNAMGLISVSSYGA